MILTDVPAEYITNDSDRYAINEKGVRWSQEWADRVTFFTNNVFTSAFLDGKFTLLPWQEWFLRKLYGFRRPDGKRAFRRFLIHCGKKNGKTTIVAAVAAIEAFAAGVKTPRIAVGSTTQQNAEQVADEIRATLANSPLGKFCDDKKSRCRIEIPSLNGRIWSLARNASGAEGLNLSCCLIDEYHGHQDKGKLYKALKYSTKSRRGLVGVISTAGCDVSHPYYLLYTHAKRVANSEEIDPTILPMIFEADADGDPADPAQWHKANPSLGITQEIEEFEAEYKAAQCSVADFMAWKQYCLNLWTRPEDTAFIDLQQFDRNALAIPDDVLLKCPCWGSLDGSTGIDPSSAALCWLLPDGFRDGKGVARRFYVKSWAWVCAKAVEGGRDKVNADAYREYVRAGSMVQTPGDFIEHRLILEWLRTQAKKYRVKSFRFDGSNVQIIGETLMSEGYAVEFVPQYHRHYNWPMRELEKAIIDGRLGHDGSRWLRDCTGNARIQMNASEEIRPVKSDPTQKIDGFISMVLAFTPAALAAAKTPKKARIEVW